MIPDETLPPEGDNPFAASPFAPARLAYAGHPVQPRLGIGHLMLLTAAIAAALAIERLRWDLPQTRGVFYLVLSVAKAFAYGPALASMPLWLHRRVVGGPAFPVQPGHWLLLVNGVLWIVSNAAWAVVHLLADRSSQWIWILYSCGQYGLHAAAWGSVLLWLRDAAHWRLFFSAAATLRAVMALLSILPMRVGFWGFSPILGLLLHGILLLCLIAAVATDRRLSIRRDWLHWTGVSAAFGVLLGALATCIYMVLGPSLR